MTRSELRSVMSDTAPSLEAVLEPLMRTPQCSFIWGLMVSNRWYLIPSIGDQKALNRAAPYWGYLEGSWGVLANEDPSIHGTSLLIGLKGVVEAKG